jgi:PIN domain nuclease of toxin-antitoxin system
MLLLDSHVLLWVPKGNSQLGPVARSTISGADAVHVSAVSVRELTIKSMLGKLVIRPDFSPRLSRNRG